MKNKLTPFLLQIIHFDHHIHYCEWKINKVYEFNV